VNVDLNVISLCKTFVKYKQYTNTIQLMILLRCISYIVSFNDMLRLQLWAIFRLITFLSKVKYTINKCYCCYVRDLVGNNNNNIVNCIFYLTKKSNRRSQWPRCLRCRSTTARLLRSWVRIPPRDWMFVCSECCVLSGRGLCDGLIILSEESYRLWRVVVCDHETSQAMRLKPARGL